MKGLGVDVVSLAEMHDTLETAGNSFLERVFTQGELLAVPTGHLRLSNIASRFAVKEAVFKCLRGTWTPDASFTDIVVTTAADGAPEVAVHGPLAALVSGDIVVSLSTAGGTAVAVAMMG
jgi:phosphopantetheine--protein transferase-like protein